MSQMQSRAVIALAMAAMLGVYACDDEPTPPEPVPGDLVVSLLSPNGAEGAVVLETADEGIIGTSVVAGQAAHWRAGGTSRIVVFLDEPGDIRFTLSVEDVNAPPRLEIVEVADGGNALRADLTGYGVVVEPATGA